MVRTEGPVLIRPPAPLISPLRVSGLAPPALRFALRLIALLRVTAPVLLRLLAPATVSAPVPSAALLPMTRPPALRVVPPWKVLTPLRVRSAAPFLINWLVPLTTPSRVGALLPPMLRSAFTAMSLAMATPVLLYSVEAPATVNAPLLKGFALPTVRPPAFNVVPPRKVLAPLRIRLAAPFLVRPQLPPTTPPRVRSAVPPIFRLPVAFTALIRVTPVLASSVVPSAVFNVPPTPSAVLEPTISEPALSEVLPV